MDEVGGFGPDRRARAVVLTFDNLGEASELERGSWRADAELGRHPSVTVALPRLLDELDAHRLSATFFLEAINCELYPDAVLEIARRGHEVGMHGWRHETWGQLSAGEESDALDRGLRAFGQLGIEVFGFRPPGGELTPRSASLLRQEGLRWCSPAGGAPGRRDRLVYVPFEWPLVDAYHLMAQFGELRRKLGDGADPVAGADLADRLAAALTDGDGDGDGRGVQTVVLHPFLMLDETWWAGVRRLLGLIAGLADEGRAWVVGGGDFAEWLPPTGPE